MLNASKLVSCGRAVPLHSNLRASGVAARVQGPSALSQPCNKRTSACARLQGRTLLDAHRLCVARGCVRVCGALQPRHFWVCKARHPSLDASARAQSGHASPHRNVPLPCHQPALGARCCNFQSLARWRDAPWCFKVVIASSRYTARSLNSGLGPCRAYAQPAHQTRCAFFQLWTYGPASLTSVRICPNMQGVAGQQTKALHTLLLRPGAERLRPYSDVPFQAVWVVQAHVVDADTVPSSNVARFYIVTQALASRVQRASYARPLVCAARTGCAALRIHSCMQPGGAPGCASPSISSYVNGAAHLQRCPRAPQRAT